MKFLRIQLAVIFFAQLSMAESYYGGPITDAFERVNPRRNITISIGTDIDQCIRVVNNLRRQELPLNNEGSGLTQTEEAIAKSTSVTLGTLGTYLSAKTEMDERIIGLKKDLELMSKQLGDFKEGQQLANKSGKLKVSYGIPDKYADIIEKQIYEIEKLQDRLTKYVDASKLKQIPQLASEYEGLGKLIAELKLNTAGLKKSILIPFDRVSTSNSAGAYADDVIEGLSNISKRVSTMLKQSSSIASLLKSNITNEAANLATLQMTKKVVGRLVPFVGTALIADDALQLSPIVYHAAREKWIENEPSSANLLDENLFDAEKDPVELCKSIIDSGKSDILEVKASKVFSSLEYAYANKTGEHQNGVKRRRSI